MSQSFCCYSKTSVVLAVHNFLVSNFDRTSNNFLSILCLLVHVTIENSSSQADVQCSNVRSFFVNFCRYICKSVKSLSFLESVLTFVSCNGECAQCRFICLGSFDYPSAQYELIFDRNSCNVRSQVSPLTFDSTVPHFQQTGSFFVLLKFNFKWMKSYFYSFVIFTKLTTCDTNSLRLRFQSYLNGRHLSLSQILFPHLLVGAIVSVCPSV